MTYDDRTDYEQKKQSKVIVLVDSHASANQKRSRRQKSQILYEKGKVLLCQVCFVCTWPSHPEHTQHAVRITLTFQHHFLL